ncbi:hypothetical protein KPC83_00970 [Collinsella sp. zg1085]|uniref:hypothetical protein n=1 Tax=Collinsella sp. zg1085 TaxID=2844380 RepID=UPI001C0D20D0|nr:hypothetical protein [Collinsella sp. zg1085]QWT17766.1 hypothetical protein KPC83_00970 [Collinsella sp. zg1085]
MPTSDAQKRATNNYRKKNIRNYNLSLSPVDADLIQWLDAQDNKQGYLKRLVREDMERKKRD